MASVAVDVSLMKLHYWLKTPNEKFFHVYSSGHVGTNSLCGEGKDIVNIENINLPGDRSPCCFKCMSLLYGFSLPKL